MATIVETKPSDARIRVALIIEAGKIKPVWFEEIDRPSKGRIFVKEVCMVWEHMEGAARIINFAVWDGVNQYRLSLNAKYFTWSLEITEEAEFPFRY